MKKEALCCEESRSFKTLPMFLVLCESEARKALTCNEFFKKYVKSCF